ncbi:hypothetical protein [Desulfosporosinus sp. SB140]|uniref:hypothetical protein n=1 Tax=Desulfosporosinus paludis TaxID=3115649 RepID=UPI003890FFCF
MNLPTILLGVVLVMLFALAIRFLVKNGSCSVCVEKGNCHSSKASDVSAGCGGHCSGCHSCPSSSAPLKH